MEKGCIEAPNEPPRQRNIARQHAAAGNDPPGHAPRGVTVHGPPALGKTGAAADADPLREALLDAALREDAMSDEAREALMDDLVHEDRECRP